MLYYMWEIDYNLMNTIEIFDFMYSIYLIALGFLPLDTSLLARFILIMVHHTYMYITLRELTNALG